jgi:hypothetical protein
MSKEPAPTKGVTPNMHGVLGVLVDEAPSTVLFGKRLNTSPYDPLLLQLQRAGAGKFLKFEDKRAKASVAARAKKLNIKILFGEEGETLWVMLATVDLSNNGHVDPVPEAKAKSLAKSLNDIVLEAVITKRDKPGLITTWARLNGAPSVGISAVDNVLSGLLRAGKIKLKPAIKGLDGDRWMVA